MENTSHTKSSHVFAGSNWLESYKRNLHTHDQTKYVKHGVADK